MLASRTTLTTCPSARGQALKLSTAAKPNHGLRFAHFKRIQVASNHVAAVKTKEEEPEIVEQEEEEEFTTGPILSNNQVQTLLTVLCEDTNIAELTLKTSGFKLYVRRSMKAGAAAGPAAPAPVAAPAPSPAPSPEFLPTPVAVQSIDEDVVDESLVYAFAPKVGIFRRDRYVKGKKVSKGPVVSVGDEVKKGQHMGYVEQLGTHVPVEAPQAGEVASVLLEDGAPVEYKQVVFEIAPFFGGHIIGDRKHV